MSGTKLIALWVAVAARTGLERFFRCGLEFDRTFKRVEVDAATADRLNEEPALDVRDTDPDAEAAAAAKAVADAEAAAKAKAAADAEAAAKAKAAADAEAAALSKIEAAAKAKAGADGDVAAKATATKANADKAGK